MIQETVDRGRKRKLKIWPIQDDQMNMTKKFVHDRKDHTDKNKPLEHDQKCTTTTNNIKKNCINNRYFCLILIYFSCFSPFLGFMKKVKTYFNQHLPCAAPKHWLKYTTYKKDNKKLLWKPPAFKSAPKI